MSPRVVLVGPPGAGKTTVGKRLAKRLGVGFRDTDADIVVAAGKPIAEIFIESGEEQFRALERDAVAQALRDHDGVLALGGGAVLAADTRDLLRDQNVVFLSVGLAGAVRRVGLATSRPVLAVNPRGVLRELLAERLPLYRAVARAEVVTDDKPPGSVVEELLRLV